MIGEEEEDAHEAAEVKLRKEHELPSKSEVDKHYAANHVPYRSWCKHCVMGKKDNPHHRRIEKKEKDAIPTVSWDYGYFGDKGEEEDDDVEEELRKKGMPTLFAVDGNTGYLMANVVPKKGVNGYAVKRISQNMNLLGYKRVNVKTDQEPAIKALKIAVTKETAVDIVPEESPVGESQSNPEVEGAIKLVKGQVRVMKLAVQSRYHTEIPENHPIVPWMIPEAANSINRYHVGMDGKTRRERLKGKKWKREVADFAECIYYLKLKSKEDKSWEERWAEGVWLGVREESGEILVGTEKGIVRARAFERKASEQERWNKEWLDKIKGLSLIHI